MGWFIHGAEGSLEGSFGKKEEGYSHGLQWHCVSNCHRVLWRLEVGESLSPNSLSSPKEIKPSLLEGLYSPTADRVG